MNSAPQRPSRLRRFAAVVFWALVIYAIIGFLALPPIIHDQAEQQLAGLLGRPVFIKSVRLNPFTLSITVNGLRILEKHDLTFAAWEQVHVNIQLSSLWDRALVFQEVRIVKPYARVQVNKDYTLNCSDIIAKFSQTNNVAISELPKTSEPLAVRIHHLRISGATASYTDFTPSHPFTRRIGPLDINLDNFRTDPENKNNYAFVGTTDAGERFAWNGFFSLNPIRSHGELLIENLALSKYSPLYRDLTKFEIRDGFIGLQGHYDVELSATNRVMAVTNVTFNLKSLKVAEQGAASNLVELARFAISGVSVDAVHRSAEIRSIAGYGGRIDLKRDRNAAINVVELSKPPANAGPAPGGILLLLRSVTNAVTMLLASTNQWTATVHNVSLWEGTTIWEDQVNSRPTRLVIDHMELSATNISNVPGTNLTASLALRWNTNGSMRAEVSASFQPPTVDAHLVLDQIDLHPVDPYLETRVNVIFLRSKFGLEADIKLRTTTNRLPEVTFAGDMRLEGLSTIDGVLGEDLLGWKSFRFSGINANLNPPAVAVREVVLEDFITRVVVETNHTVNLLAALKLGAPSPDASNEADRAGGPPSAVDGAHGMARPTTNEPPADAPKISIGTVTISNAQALFIDRSIRPNARLTLEEVNGTIANLSSADAQHADVNLRAKVFGGALMEIIGTVNPLGHGKDTDLRLQLHDLDLTPTSPYSGKFAGYRIAKGKLGLDLNYHIANRQLVASNVIVLDQFTFGEKVPGTNATKLPVKLAIAILKDRDGKIFLDVPIAGSIDNPEFKLGKVISRTILNIIVKIATSPFSVLGALFGGGGEEMGYQVFAPGSSTLATNETAKLDSLLKGLYARPALQVGVEGSVDAVADLDALRRQKLGVQLQQVKWQALRKAARTSTRPEDVAVASDERDALIQDLYRQILTQSVTAAATNSIAAVAGTNVVRKPVTAAPFRNTQTDKGAVQLLRSPGKQRPASTPGTSANSAGNSSATGAVDIEQAVLQTIAVTDEEFATLANARAQTVKAYLLQGGQVTQDRVFLTEREAGSVQLDGSKTVLQLQ